MTWHVLYRRALLVLVLGCLLLPGASLTYAGFERGAPPVPTLPIPTPPQIDAVPTASAGWLPDVTLDATALYGGLYRVGSWVPVQVTVQNDNDDMTAEVRVNTRSGGTFAAPLDLPHGSRKSVIIYVHVTDFTRHLNVQLVDAMAGSRLLLPTQRLMLDPQSSDDHLLAVVAADGAPLRLPGTLVGSIPVTHIPLDPGMLPERAQGLSMFDTLILSDVATNTLHDAQRQALYEWVLRGGQLVLAGGIGAQRTLEGLPPALQSVRFVALQQVPAGTIPEAVATTQADLALAQVELLSPRARMLSGFTLPGATPDAARTYPLLVEQPVGVGVVTFFAGALTDALLAFQPDEELFWNSLLYQRSSIPPGFSGPAHVDIDHFTESNVATALTRLPALQLPSLLTLGVLLLVYVVLVGPVMFFLLRFLDRQVLGWIIVPLLTIVFALVAYGLGYAQRGGDVVLNEITLVEPLHTGAGDPALARMRSFVGVFSPASQSYALTTPRPVLLRPISLFGPWDHRMVEQVGVFRQLASATGSAGAEVSNLEVARWSMRAVLADEVRPYQGITARVTLNEETLDALVVNDGDVPLRDVVLVQGNRVARLGDLAPAEQRSATLQHHEGERRQVIFDGSMPLSYLIYGEQIDQSHQPGGQPLPPAIQMQVGLLDSIFSYGPTMRDTQPMVLAWADRAWLDVTVPGQRTARQQLSLIMLNPVLDVTGERLTLGTGWLERQIDTGTGVTCMGNQGLGFTLSGQPVRQTLRLPRDLAGFQPQEMQLVTAADGAWPGELQSRLYDWNSGDWVPFVLGGRPVSVDQPGRFLNDRGEIWILFEDGMSNAGCLYVDATMTGTVAAE